MNEREIAFATLVGLRQRLAAGEVTARDVVDVFLERAESMNPTARAFIRVTADAARAEAMACDASSDRATLKGLPFASKDLIDVAGVPTTGGSRVLHDNIAESDAAVVSRMKSSGAVSLGKLNLHEFAYGATGENPVYGTAPNAYDMARLAGGSSSGSAAAVAFGMAPCAFGTDTGGSVRAPAALCGLVGLKPTLGRVSARGVVPYSWSLDHVGTVTRTVADAALLLGVVAGHDPGDPQSANAPVGDYMAGLDGDGDLDDIRIGVPRAFFFEHADAEILDAAEAVLKSLEARGATLLDVEPPSMEHTRTVSLTVQMPEALSYHARYLEERGDLYGDDFRAGLALGQCLLAEHYVRAKRMMTLYRQAVDAVFEDVDVLLTPAVPVIAPEIGAVRVSVGASDEPAGNAITRYTSFFNMTGHPAITVPSGMHSAGLPMGIQLIARHFDEVCLFRVAGAIEREPAFRCPVPSNAE